MQHNDAFANKGAKENTGNALGSFEPQFKETITKGFRVRLTKIGTQGNHSAG